MKRSEKIAAAWPESESQMLSALRSWLVDERGADVHEEICMVAGEAVADLVAISKRQGIPQAHVIEGKLSMSADLLRQATWWTQHADAVWIALPKPKGRTASMRARNIEKRAKYWLTLERLGLGLIELEADSKGKPVIDVVLKPTEMDAGRGAALLKKLRPELRGVAPAGSAGGSRTSAWAKTKAALMEAAGVEPGTPLKYLVKRIDHHYPSDQKARSEISRMARSSGGVAGLRFEGDEMRAFIK